MASGSALLTIQHVLPPWHWMRVVFPQARAPSPPGSLYGSHDGRGMRRAISSQFLVRNNIKVIHCYSAMAHISLTGLLDELLRLLRHRVQAPYCLLKVCVDVLQHLVLLVQLLRYLQAIRPASHKSHRRRRRRRGQGTKGKGSMPICKATRAAKLTELIVATAYKNYSLQSCTIMDDRYFCRSKGALSPDVP